MVRTFTAAALAGAALICTAGHAALTLRNGSFEQTGAQYQPVIGGLYAASDWVNTSAYDIQASSAVSGAEGTPAAVGARFLRLASDSPDPQNTGSIYQQLGTIDAGALYTLTGLALGGASTAQGYGFTYTFASAASGGTVFATGTLDGLAQGSSTAFSLSFAGTQANAGQSVFLRLAALPSASGTARRGGVDDLQLSAVPEPATWGLTIVGFGLAGTALRRRSPATLRPA